MNQKTYRATVLIVNIDPDEYPDFFKEGIDPKDAVRRLLYAKLHESFGYTPLDIVEVEEEV